MNVHGGLVNATSIRVIWDPVPLDDRNGLILGYKVSHNNSGERPEKTLYDSRINEAILGNLNEFTTYNICVLAFTIKGDGPENCTLVITDEHRKNRCRFLVVIDLVYCSFLFVLLFSCYVFSVYSRLYMFPTGR